MSFDVENSICEKLTSESIQDVYDALVVIRDYYLGDENKMARLLNCSVIQLIMPFLSSQSFHDTCLYIIESLSGKKEFANVVIKEGGAETLAQFVDYCEEPEIRISACRVLSNLIKCGSEFESVDLEKILCSVSNYLCEFGDTKSLQIIFRTLESFGRFPFLKRSQVYKRTVFNISAFLTSPFPDILGHACKCLAYFTRYSHSLGDVDNSKRQELLGHLVRLCSQSTSTAQVYSLLTLINISFDETMKFDLIATGAVKLFKHVLLNARAERLKEFVALGLCNFLTPVILNANKNEDIYNTLLHVLEAEIYGDIRINVISSLSPVNYISKIVHDFLDFGYLRAIIKYLALRVKQNRVSVTCRGDKCVIRSPSTENTADGRTIYIGQSARTYLSSIPSQFSGNGVEDELLDKLFKDFMHLFNWVKNVTDYKYIDNEILRVVQEFCCCCPDKVLPMIADEEAFSVLLDYIHVTDNPCTRAENIIMRVIKHRTLFEKLIRYGFLYKLEEKVELSDSFKSLNFVFLMHEFEQEATKFQDDVYYEILISSNFKAQFYILCAASKFMRNFSVWNSIIFQANGLYILINYLSDESATTRKRAVTALCQLYQFLKNEYRRKDINELMIEIMEKQLQCSEPQPKLVREEDDYGWERSLRLKSTSKCCYQDSHFDVIVKTQDDEKIKANKEKLCEKSKYFKDILLRKSKENNSNFVSIKTDKHSENVLLIFHFLHGCQLNSACVDFKQMPFSRLLELLTDCEDFLVTDLKLTVEDEIYYHLNPTTVYDTFVRSKLYGSPKLAKKALAYALNFSVEDKSNLWRCFEELLNLGKYFNFHEDVKSIIMELVSKINEKSNGLAETAK